MRNSNSCKFLPLTLLLVTLPCCIYSQKADKTPKPGIFDFISREEVGEIEILIDLDTLLSDIRRTDYVKATFKMENEKGDDLEIPVKVRPRGKFRRMKCNFPPLKLKFKKDDLAERGMNKYNEFKLVTHCLKDEQQAKEMILKEFLAYKIFNELTPYSFNVQLVRITYRHNGKSRKIKQWGILIEDQESLADRNGAKVVSRIGIPLDSLHKNQEKLASLFQYMIGNCDWSYFLARNMEFIQLDDNRILPVPYDFDYCGFVNAPYSAPNAQIGQKSVKDRVYLGNSDSHEEIYGMVSYFKTKEKDVLSIVDNCKKLPGDVRSELKSYLEDFFKLLDDQEKATAIFTESNTAHH